MAAAARRAETSARWRPSPVNGSRNPAASPTTSQPGPARRATRQPSGLAPAIASVARPARHASGSPPSGGTAARTRSAVVAAPSRRQVATPSIAGEHDADVDSAARHGRDPAVRAAGQDDHPRVPGSIAGLVREVPRQADPPAERRRPVDASRARPPGTAVRRRHHDPRASIASSPASTSVARRDRPGRRRGPGSRSGRRRRTIGRGRAGRDRAPTGRSRRPCPGSSAGRCRSSAP